MNSVNMNLLQDDIFTTLHACDDIEFVILTLMCLIVVVEVV